MLRMRTTLASMSADAPRRPVGLLLATLTGLLALLPGSVSAEEALPDIELLYYLGSWEGTDEDWVLLSEQEEEARPRDSAANDAESQESDDER